MLCLLTPGRNSIHPRSVCARLLKLFLETCVQSHVPPGQVDAKKFAIFIKEENYLRSGNTAIIKEIERQKVATLKKKVDYLVNYAAPRLVAAHPNSLVGEMLIDEALERMYALPPGDTTV